MVATEQSPMHAQLDELIGTFPLTHGEREYALGIWQRGNEPYLRINDQSIRPLSCAAKQPDVSQDDLMREILEQTFWLFANPAKSLSVTVKGQTENSYMTFTLAQEEPRRDDYGKDVPTGYCLKAAGTTLRASHPLDFSGAVAWMARMLKEAARMGRIVSCSCA